MRYGIALGSNLGDRLDHLCRATNLILASFKGAKLLAAAPVYETSPVDCPEGSLAFFNSVIEIDVDREPLAVLKELRSIEFMLGRPDVRGHHAPRNVDLDVLYADDVVMEHPDLRLPHPRLTQRRFVMQPLADIRPGLVLPLQKKSVADLLKDLDSNEPPLSLVTSDWLRND